MSISKKQEARALSADEKDLVAKSHFPRLAELPDEELPSVLKLVRERRDRARTQARQRRREMRGKSAPKGATPSAADEGSRVKAAVLSAAVKRLNGEAERRRRMTARTSLVDSARTALRLKQQNEDGGGAPFNSRHAHAGMRKVSNRRPDDLVRPMEKGRLRKAGSVAQAKRDAR
ncbi:MAG: hypothetical protein JWL93_161 [Hyphomicrobiales bacterium]|nr:hypothetical protein [Hyphomicrobiales bacterium]